ncbi:MULTISPECIES: helix-turn-helix domain-containing protein [Streptococcus]|uniref:helix-turn-helix domain-containing protein n=1 Tax=Streptococcus TaxID=1301 RepID=UPI00228384F7|nr:MULTISPECIES: helix-turn-helix transcriptional regulator [Streptococcus]MCY7024209.1 helix-turn-helix transcriptional regulator [Streptococcus sanguinis]MDQ8692210.1 helix-turn-helix transcriptional regulator [Streptococcus sp. IsoGale022]
MSTVSYKKLWKLLIDKDMKKKDLREATGISTASMAKLSKNENLTTDVLLRICDALKCDISDIMEISFADENQSDNEEDEKV